MVGDLVTQQSINLAHMTHRILPRRGLGAHGAAEADHTMDSVATSNLATIATLRRSPQHSQIHTPAPRSGLSSMLRWTSTPSKSGGVSVRQRFKAECVVASSAIGVQAGNVKRSTQARAVVTVRFRPCR